MDKNYIVILLVLLVMIPITMGFEYTIEEVNNCKGTIRISDRTVYDGIYTIKDCDWLNGMWICPCKPLPRDLILIYENEKEEIYDFVVEYYVGDNNPDNKRTHSHEGLKLGKPKEEKKSFSLPLLKTSSKNLLIIGLIIVGIIILVIVGIIIKKIYDNQDTENKNDYPTQYKEDNEETMILDEDVTNILDKYG